MGCSPRRRAVVICRACEVRVAVPERLVPACRPASYHIRWQIIATPCGKGRGGFRTDKLTPGKHLRHPCPECITVVESYQVKGAGGDDRVMGHRVIACCRHRPCIIKRTDDTRKFSGDCFTAAVPLPLFHHLVADAPDENRRVIAVAKHHCLKVPSVPLVKVKSVVEFCLFNFPNVKGFVHDDKSHSVTQIEQLGSRRVVRCAYPVTAHLLKYIKLPFDGTGVDGSAEATKVMMIAHPLYYNRFTVEDESLFRVKFKRPDACNSLIHIGQQLAGPDPGFNPVKLRVLQ